MADPLAQGIRAANTLVWAAPGMRPPCACYNTDAMAALHAIENGMRAHLDHRETSAQSPLAGMTVVVLGAGGAGRALTVGAALAGARVIVANRTVSRAEGVVRDVASVAPQASVTAVSLEDVASGRVRGAVLANTTQLGMYPQVTPAQPAISSASFLLAQT